MEYINSLSDTNNETINEMVLLFLIIERLLHIIQTGANHDDTDFLDHAEKNLIDDDNGFEHLPIPVYSYLNPSMGVQFILHIMISMGHFATEIDMTLHASIR